MNVQHVVDQIPDKNSIDGQFCFDLIDSYCCFDLYDVSFHADLYLDEVCCYGTYIIVHIIYIYI